jgi:hypothetical protein
MGKPEVLQVTVIEQLPGNLPTYNILGLRSFNEDVWPAFPELF